MKKTGRNVLIALGAVGACAAVAGAVSYAVTKKLFSIALERKMPGDRSNTTRMIKGPEWLEDMLAIQKKNAEKLLRSVYEDVEITAFDGIKLVGHYKKTEGAERTVICFHGWRSTWAKDFGGISDFLESNGCNVLYVEQRGQNNSGGDHMGFGLLERYDCLSWVNRVVSFGDGLPIYLSGISMGAATVMMAAGLELPDQVHGIVADCGYTSPDAIWKYVTEKNLHLPYTGFRRKVIEDLCRRKLNSESSRYSCADALAKAKVPVLFIHGSSDHLVPVRMSYENYLACASPKRLLIVPGAEHGMSYLIETEKYQQAVLDFWRDFD